MARSFYIVTPVSLAGAASAEYGDLKGAEKGLSEQVPGDYLIVEVVRRVSGQVVPERVRWNVEATRTRVAKATRTPRKKKGDAGAPSAS